MKLFGLVIAGGQSTRMGEDKASLPIEATTWQDHARSVLSECVSDVFISKRAQANAGLNYGPGVLFDDHHEIGPAAGLLRAHRENPNAHWLVLAVDFPLVSELDIRHLVESHKDADLTCYVHGDQTPEPLFAIWSPVALKKLAHNVALGCTGPMSTLLTCSVTHVAPLSNRVLKNINTPEQWREAQERALLRIPNPDSRGPSLGKF